MHTPTTPSVSRRRFLKNATTAAAFAGFPMILPRGVLAADGQPGANDRIRIGFIGMGRQAGALLSELARLPAGRVVAVADVNLPRAEAVASRHQAAAFQDYRRLLDRKDVDAVITATPEHWRVLICTQACAAGKDVYAEKPLSLTIREGRLIADAARRHKRVFQTGSQQRSMIRNRIACDFLRSGKAGKILKVIAHNYPTPWEHRLPAQPIPAGLDWDMWCGPAPRVDYHTDLYQPRANPGWLSFRPYSGGEMTGWGAHGLDQIQWALGMDASGPIEAWVEGGALDSPVYSAPEPAERGNKLCSASKVFMRYPGDIVVEFADAPMGGAVFHCEKGIVKINRGTCESEPHELLEDTIRNRPQGINESHLKNWLDCIRSREKPVADVEIGHRSASVCHLGNIARWTGRRLRWDPVAERFPEDADANRHLDRERRKPWTLPGDV
jgi:predicted dehydrogenase